MHFEDDCSYRLRAEYVDVTEINQGIKSLVYFNARETKIFKVFNGKNETNSDEEGTFKEIMNEKESGVMIEATSTEYFSHDLSMIASFKKPADNQNYYVSQDGWIKGQVLEMRPGGW